MMKLEELDLDTFMNAIIKVNKLMADEKACNSLLDAARKDTPIIDELMAEMNKLLKHKDGPQKEKGVAAAERDLTVLLALREIEKGEA
jgi:hypothetical protein